ncbi:MAG: hypothetical protein U1E53_26975 [Dongiaceae bacterium]
MSGLPGGIVGLRREARLLARLAPGIRVACSGADPGRAARLAERLLAEGAPGLVSFGLAGGLAPELAPGRLLLPASVLLPDGGALAVDPAWHARARAALPAADAAPIAGSDHALADPRPRPRCAGPAPSRSTWRATRWRAPRPRPGCRSW